ncbi:MAG: diguanylate cyclase [Roseburia sp.]|nr:diguanylate cyclase [Roseburia sp.]
MFLWVALAIAVLSVVGIFVSSFGEGEADEEETIVDEGFESFELGWKNQYGLSYDLTKVFQRERVNDTTTVVSVTKNIPDDFKGGALFFRTNNVVVNVYLNDKPVSYVYENGDYLGMPTFQSYRLIRFNEKDAGKEIRLEMYPTLFSFNCGIDNVYFGDSSMIVMNKVADGIFPLILTAILFFAGLFFVCIGVITHNVMEHYRGMIFYGLFSVFLSVWILSGTVWIYLFTDNPKVIDIGLHLYLMTAILFGLLYVYDVFRLVHISMYRVLLCVWALMTVAFVALMISGILQPGQLLFVEHILIVIAAVVLLIEMFSYLVYHQGNKEKTKLFNFGIIFFVIFGLYDICRFYQGNDGDYSAATRIGVILLTVTAAAMEIKEAITLLQLGIKAGKIGKIAYTDANTGIGNSAAFKLKMDMLEVTRTNYTYIGIIQFDVNNLKIINDTKGHEAGDLLIKTAANIIDRSFGTIGTCYRVGGDEFVAITTYSHAPLACEEAISRFESLIEQFNQNPTKPFELRIAYGVAYYQNTENRYITLKEVHKIADERMYNKKKELKARYAKTPEEAVIR